MQNLLAILILLYVQNNNKPRQKLSWLISVSILSLIAQVNLFVQLYCSRYEGYEVSNTTLKFLLQMVSLEV